MGTNQIFPLKLVGIKNDILTFEHGYCKDIVISIPEMSILRDNISLAHFPDQLQEWKDKGVNSLCMELSSHARFSPQTRKIETEYQHIRLFEVIAWG